MKDLRTGPDQLDKSSRQEANKAKARKLTLILGVVSVLFLLAMMSRVMFP